MNINLQDAKQLLIGLCFSAPMIALLVYVLTAGQS
jgi:hypothetical protein